MAIKTVRVNADIKGARATKVWCSSSNKSITIREAYPTRGTTSFSNLPLAYKEATLYIDYYGYNNKYYGYGGTNFYVRDTLGNKFTGSNTVSKPYTNKTSNFSFSHTIYQDGATVPFTGNPSWNGEEDIQVFGCSVSSAYIEFKVEVADSTINNLLVTGNFWEQDITVNWRAENQVGYEYELYYNNSKIKSGSGGKESSFIIPAYTFKGIEQASIRIRNYSVDDEGIKYYSNWIEQNITLKDIEATISDLIVNGNLWEAPIEVSWQSQNQQQFRIEAWKNNIKAKEYTGTTDTRYIIPKNQFEAGEYTFKVYVAYANRYKNYQSKTVILKNIQPTIENLSLSGSNIDYDLLLSWESTYQSKVLIEIYKGDSKVNTINLTTEKKYQIDNNTLETGTYTFKVKVAYTSLTGDRWSDYKQLNTTLIESFPSIGVLQPDGTILDKNDNIKAWWTSQNQTKYKLEVIGSGYSFMGTTEKEHIIPMGTLHVGTHTLKLTVTFVTSNSVEKTVVKESQFIVTGKPNTPTITSLSTYAYNRPVITWDSVEQLGFICVIEDINGLEVWSSQWQNGLITRVKCMKYLPNGTYKAKVKIMNEFTHESDFAVKEFEIGVNEDVEITLQVEDVKLGKKLSWSNIDDYYDCFYIIRNGRVIQKTDKLEYIDYACLHGENSYIIRGVTGNDTYKDSLEVIADFILPYSTLATVNHMKEQINCGIQRNLNEMGISSSLDGEIIYLTGKEDPVVIYGEHTTEEYSLNFAIKNYHIFYEMWKRREPFIYRNKRGEVLYFSIASQSLKIDVFGGVYTATALKIDYNEVIEYD